MDDRMLLRFSANTDHVVIQVLSIAFHTAVELPIMQAKALHSRLETVIAEAEGFMPGTKSFYEWDV